MLLSFLYSSTCTSTYIMMSLSKAVFTSLCLFLLHFSLGLWIGGWVLGSSAWRAAVCTHLNARSARVKGLQLIVSLVLVARATGRQVYTCTCNIICINVQCTCTCTCTEINLQAMTLLNHVGVYSMSYNATWDLLLALTQQANLLSKIQGGHWIWVYDSLNIHSPTRHERQGEAIHIHVCACACACQKRSLTHRTGSQGWASRCPLMYMYMFVCL